jgi:predicted acylesterase/phospholipase RssA
VALALVHPAETEVPTGTRRWIDDRPLSSSHHLRRGDATTVGRLARLLSGQATSLVLGGGGARGFAHLGVCSVLEEEGVDIDLVAGTSIGAVMGASLAIGWPSARARATLVDAFRDLFDYTVPSVSLLRGERITRKMRAFVGDLDIADLWVPFFCMSTNLTTADAHVHDRGDLVTALRASIAIPGVLPPVPIGGELHVDGGVLDNVPVEEMRRRNPTGRILAIDVAPAEGPTAPHDYGLFAGGWASWRARRRGRPAPPSLLTTMVRSSLIAAVRDRGRIVRDGIADLYVDLTVEGGGMLDFSAAEAIIDAGAASVAPVLHAWLHDGADPGGPGRYVKTDPAPAPGV